MLFLYGTMEAVKPQWAHEDKYKYNYTEEFWAMPDTIKAKDSTAIAETIENYFLSGEVDKIEIAYSRLGWDQLVMIQINSVQQEF